MVVGSFIPRGSVSAEPDEDLQGRKTGVVR